MNEKEIEIRGLVREHVSLNHNIRQYKEKVFVASNRQQRIKERIRTLVDGPVVLTIGKNHYLVNPDTGMIVPVQKIS